MHSAYFRYYSGLHGVSLFTSRTLSFCLSLNQSPSLSILCARQLTLELFEAIEDVLLAITEPIRSLLMLLPV